jgi:outer membrane phospholipase A
VELITASGTTRLVRAQTTSESQPLELHPGQFYRQLYQLALPLDLSATLQVQLADQASTVTLIEVAPAPHLAGAVNLGDGDDLAAVSYHSLKDIESLYQSYTADLFTYEPIFFLVGSDPSKSKFQLSFKYRLLNRSGTLSQKYPWLSGLHFAYTQTSFWDLASDSIPFNDTSYKPQLMFQTENLSRLDALAGFFLRAGLTHESNGRDGDGSRSTNYFYIKPMGVFYHQPSRLGIMISPKVLVYINNDNDNNPDLPDYRGHVELETRIGRAHSLMLTTNLRFARKGTSVQTDLTYPIDRLIGNNLNVYLHLQYSNSLAESLVDYQKRTETFRLGLSFFR